MAIPSPRPADFGPSSAVSRDDQKPIHPGSLPDALHRLARRSWLGVMVVLVSAVTFLPVVANGWVDRDDPQNFLENRDFRGVGPAQIRWAFTSFQLGVYQPVAWMLLGAEYQLFGLAPWGYHLTSLVMHCANVIVLMILSAEVLKRCRVADGRLALDDRSRNLGAATVALLFAVHPLRVEVVAWASCQPYLPCALFSMLACLAYLKGAGAPARARAGWLAITWAFYVLALCCKTPAIALPVALLILDAVPLHRFSDPGKSRWSAVAVAFVEKLPFAAIGAVFFALALAGKYVSNPSNVSERTIGIAQRLIRACYSGGFYVEKTLWPSGLSAIYEWPEKVSALDAWVAPLVLATVALTIVAGGLGRYSAGPAAAWFVYLVLLSPVSGFVRSGYAVVADRYAYLATIPLFVASSYPLAMLWRRQRLATPTLIVILGLILAMCAISWQLSRTWHDSDTLIARADDAGTLTRPTYLMQRGKHHELRGEFQDAEKLFRQAAELAPDRADVAERLGSYLMARRRVPEAQAWFERSVRIDPQFVAGYNSLGLALAQYGHIREAKEQFETALRHQPYFVDARLNLASLLRHQGQLNEAADHYGRVLRTDPSNERARSGLDAIAAETQRPGFAQ
jgi:protein O-mannosyl-transferase